MKKVSLLERKRKAAARRFLMKLRKRGAYIGDVISPSGETWEAELPGPPIVTAVRIKKKDVRRRLNQGRGKRETIGL